ncbi:MAG: hypothetical protein ACI9F1_002621, partial [Colwellia sp.]
LQADNSFVLLDSSYFLSYKKLTVCNKTINLKS